MRSAVHGFASTDRKGCSGAIAGKMAGGSRYRGPVQFGAAHESCAGFYSPAQVEQVNRGQEAGPSTYLDGSHCRAQSTSFESPARTKAKTARVNIVQGIRPVTSALLRRRRKKPSVEQAHQIMNTQLSPVLGVATQFECIGQVG
jgi:hypothetical protein